MTTPRRPDGLTERQHAIYSFVYEGVRDRGYQPSVTSGRSRKARTKAVSRSPRFFRRSPRFKIVVYTSPESVSGAAGRSGSIGSAGVRPARAKAASLAAVIRAIASALSHRRTDPR